jgi:hypothetical protein
MSSLINVPVYMALTPVLDFFRDGVERLVIRFALSWPGDAAPETFPRHAFPGACRDFFTTIFPNADRSRWGLRWVLRRKSLQFSVFSLQPSALSIQSLDSTGAAKLKADD